jgi:DNA-binding transcriptional LysR family regulator
MIQAPVPDLRQLRYFLVVAEELSFSRAADRLHMAASPLSAAIRQLETELGVDLFLRTTRHVELTEAGKRLAAEGPPALEAIDAAFANATRAGRGVMGTLRMGASPAAREQIRPRLLARLRDRHPGIEVDASEATTGHLCRELLSRRLDVAIGFCADPTPGLARHTLTQEPVWVLMRSGHPHSKDATVSLDALREDVFVVPGASMNAGFERRLRMLCRGAGFEPETVVASFIWDDAEWPAGDDVIALITERLALAAPEHMRAAVLVPEALMPIELLWREDDDSPVLKTFLELARPSPAPVPAP